MRVEGISTSAINNQNIKTENSKPETSTEQINNAAVQNRGNNGHKEKIDENELIKSIESANEKFEIHNRRLEFSIHEKTKEIMVKVIDTENNEVIREIPPEKILDMAAKMLELAGILVDEKV